VDLRIAARVIRQMCDSTRRNQIGSDADSPTKKSAPGKNTGALDLGLSGLPSVEYCELGHRFQRSSLVSVDTA